MLVYVISLKIVIVGTCLYVAVLLFAVSSSSICYAVLLILIDAPWLYKRQSIDHFPLNVIIYGNVYDALSVILYKIIQVIYVIMKIVNPSFNRPILLSRSLVG